MQEKDLIKYLKIAGFVFLLLWQGFFLMEKANLVTADLGRHIKNGEILIKGGESFGIERSANKLLNTNFYSYTNPDFEFLNHHWGSGIIFYLIHHATGFTGTSIFYILLSMATFSVFFLIAYREVGFKVSFLLALLLMPGIAARSEIRPEVISYFFSGIFFYLLWKYQRKEISFKKTAVWLFAIEAIWINLHIGFVYGFAVIGAFGVGSLIKYFKTKNFTGLKNMFLLGCLAAAGSLINPHFFKGAIYPFLMFGNFGYRLAENQSVWFLQDFGMQDPNFLLIKIATFLLITSFVFVFWIDRRNFSWVNFSLAVVFGVLAWKAIRNFPIFFLMLLPIIAMNIKSILKLKSDFIKKIDGTILAMAMIFIMLFLLLSNSRQLSMRKGNFGLGIRPNVSAAADFFKNNSIQGPIFNNYDVGGYLIYYLFPQMRVFVDNRPEAYPEKFFKEEYIPMQESEEIWKEKSEQYGFNAVFFYRHDLTNWGQNFLVKLISNPQWKPIFVDDYNIIFLKDNEQNRQLIEKYQLPKEMFRVN